MKKTPAKNLLFMAWYILLLNNVLLTTWMLLQDSSVSVYLSMACILCRQARASVSLGLDSKNR